MTSPLRLSGMGADLGPARPGAGPPHAPSFPFRRPRLPPADLAGPPSPPFSHIYLYIHTYIYIKGFIPTPRSILSKPLLRNGPSP
ncbi:hypothetical protein Hanom_Chr11g01064741 [Helianthus anomalus]